MTKSVLLTTDIWVDGVRQTSGSTISVEDGLAGALVYSGRATYVTDPMGSGSRNAPANFAMDASGNVTGLVGPDGNIIIRPVTTYTWATRPTAADNTGVTIRVSDVGGSAGSLWISDGAYWKPVGGSVVLGGSGAAVTVSATASEEVLASFTVPGYAMGPNGIISIVHSWSMTNSANNKNLRVRWGGSGLDGDQVLNANYTTSASTRHWTEFQNRNRLDQQIVGTGSGNSLLSGGIAASIATAARTTSGDLLCSITGQKASAGETLTMERWVATLIVP